MICDSRPKQIKHINSFQLFHSLNEHREDKFEIHLGFFRVNYSFDVNNIHFYSKRVFFFIIAKKSDIM